MTNENVEKIIRGPIFILEGDDGLVYGNSQALAKEVLLLRKLLVEANDILRSAYQIALRHGDGTNWKAFIARSGEVLDHQHKAITENR